MRILLLSVNSQSFFYEQLVVPFGLASLGSYVQRDGHVIKGIDMNGPPDVIARRYLTVDPELLGEIRQFAPDLVGMSAYSSNVHNVLFWAEKIKRELPETIIALGGNHASYIGREILQKCSSVDIVIRYEGEIPFKRLCDELAGGDGDFEQVPNAAFRRGEEIVETDIMPLIQDLDALPILNRDIFKTDVDSERTQADVIGARGCPFHCTFCNCNHYWQKRYRTLSPERVVQELSMLKAKYPQLRTVRFRDEAISTSKKHCMELCDRLVEADLGLVFHAHSRLDGLDEEVICRLADAGFRQLYIGLESGSQAVLDRMRKGIRIGKVFETVEALRENRVAFRFSLMLATPGETLEETVKTIELINELDLSFSDFYFGYGVDIYPGTSECERFLQKFPEYKWLERHPLGDGYSQILDDTGKVVSVSLHGATYDKDAVQKEINGRLSTKLRKYGEWDYRRLVAAKSAVESLISRFDSKREVTRVTTMFLKILDSCGAPWGVYGNGYYFKEVLSESIKEGHFDNFAGHLYGDRETEEGKAFSAKDLRKITFLVLASSKSEIKSYSIDYYLLDQVRYAGRMLVLDSLFHLRNCYDILRDSKVEEILENVTFRPHVPFKHKVAVMLKRLRLFPLVDAVRNIVRQ